MGMKEYKNHKEVDKKFKWDLSFLLEGSTPEKAVEDIKKEWTKLIKVKDSKYNSSKEYLEYLKMEEKATHKMFKIYNYISNLNNLDVTDKVALELNEKFQYEMYKFNNELGAEDARFFKNSKKLSGWAKLPEFKDYKYLITKKLEEKKYQLPKAIQEYNLKVSRGAVDTSEIFSVITDSELDYGFAKDSKGKKLKITMANISELRKHKDKNVRKTTGINFANAYLKHKTSLSTILFQHKKQESASLLASGYKSSVEGLIFDDRVSTDFLEQLYKSVQENVHIFKPYKQMHKKFYKTKFKENITKYDWSVELVTNNTKVSVETSIEETIEAIKPFGSEYLEVTKKAFNDNWVDFMVVKNKRSGAYSIGATYGIDKKLILMNHSGDTRSTETLAHELGHSMHSYFSDKVQPTSYLSGYPIFLAEIASIFNELMLHDYWLKTLKSKKSKFYILGKQIDGFIATVLRQTEWSNYEYDLYNKIDKGEPVGNYDALSKMYYDNSKKYAILPKEKFNPKDQYPSIYVPHFYYGFYVYKYAIGQLIANIFFAKYKNEGTSALKFYIDKFLSAGGSKNPVEILKDAGIDLYDSETYKLGFQEVEKNIKEWIKLGKEIFS